MDAFNLGLLILRVVTGLVVAAHGYQKVFLGGKLAGTGRWFDSMGLRPGWFHARLAASTELGCGLALAAGFLTPFAAAGIVGVMTVAWITSHRKNGFYIFRPGQGWEYVFVLLVVATSLGTMGAGEWSLDHAMGFRLDGGWGLLVSLAGGAGTAILMLAAMWRPPKEATA